MHATIYVKLDPNFGVDSGPFDVYTNLNLVLPILTDIPRSEFITGQGLELAEIDDAATSIILISKGGCCNTTSIPIVDVTTTTTSTTTSTTTIPSIPCGTPIQYAGGQSYPSTNTISLGSGTGTTKFTFNGIINPDRFIVEWNSTVVIDTGYRGSSSYDYGGPLRNTFNNALTGDIDPITLIAYPDLVNYPDDGYPRVTNNTAFAPANPGSGSTTFTKTLSSPTTATVKVYAPGGGTQWNFTMDCPIPIPTTTTTTLTPPSTTTTTTTAAPGPTTTTTTAAPGPTTTTTLAPTTTSTTTTTTTVISTSTTTTTTTLQGILANFRVLAYADNTNGGSCFAQDVRITTGSTTIVGDAQASAGGIPGGVVEMYVPTYPNWTTYTVKSGDVIQFYGANSGNTVYYTYQKTKNASVTVLDSGTNAGLFSYTITDADTGSGALYFEGLVSAET